MKPVMKQGGQRSAFTIVELLTVMSIIVILIGLLVPALNKVKIYAMKVKQNAQFHSIEAALELFNSEFEGYPESGALDPRDQPYPGAMKLCEAMMGWDLLGFHTNSMFRSDGLGANDQMLYDPTDLSARRGPFLPLESANAYRLEDLYPPDSPGLGQFNGRNLLDGSMTGATFHVGANAGQVITFSIGDAQNVALGIDGIDVTIPGGSDAAIAAVDSAMVTIDGIRGGLGAVQNRFEYTIANLNSVSENLSAARSRILDADIAKETSEMTRNSILQQAGVSILAQANQTPLLAVSLLG